jgi:hypothetical protein
VSFNLSDHKQRIAVKSGRPDYIDRQLEELKIIVENLPGEVSAEALENRSRDVKSTTAVYIAVHMMILGVHKRI